MQIFTKVDIGLARPTNQDAADAFMLTDEIAFAIACDGMGGSSGGDIASRCAVDTISQYVKNSFSAGMSNESIAKLLKNAVLSANYDVYSLSKTNPDLAGMGTTVVAAIVTQTHAIICHVGDSRGYLINDNIIQLTSDHSVVQSLIESGKLSLSEAKSFPDKNVITRALGVEPDVFPDYSIVPVKPEDSILLCTDGLTNFTEISEVLNIFKTNSIDKVADLLISAAKSGGGGDNISVVIVSQKRG